MKPIQYETCGESIISCTSNNCSFESKDNYSPEIRCVYRVAFSYVLDSKKSLDLDTCKSREQLELFS